MLTANASLAYFDYQMRQSLKCVSLFTYYEKKYNLPTDTLHSIALKESGVTHKVHKNIIPWPWAINVAGKGFYFDSKNQAANFLLAQLREGKKNIDVGCMQINLKYHNTNFRTINQALEPCHNIEYAAKLLQEHFEKHGNWQKAIAYYHSGHLSQGGNYSKAVFKIAAKIDHNKARIAKFYNPK